MSNLNKYLEKAQVYLESDSEATPMKMPYESVASIAGVDKKTDLIDEVEGYNITFDESKQCFIGTRERFKSLYRTLKEENDAFAASMEKSKNNPAKIANKKKQEQALGYAPKKNDRTDAFRGHFAQWFGEKVNPVDPHAFDDLPDDDSDTVKYNKRVNAWHQKEGGRKPFIQKGLHGEALKKFAATSDFVNMRDKLKN